MVNKNHRQKLSENLIAYLLLLGVIGTTLLSLIGHIGWNILLEVTSHFQMQYLIIDLLLFCLLLLTRRKALIIIGLFCVSIVSTEIVPWYIPQASLESNTASNIRVLGLNVNTQNHSYSKVLSLVRKEKPDVAVFVEAGPSWVKELRSLEDILPHFVESPYGLGTIVYTRLPLSNTSFNFFGTSKNSSILGNLTVNGQVISLIATHPLPPVKPAFFQSRNRQMDRISQYIQQLKTPVVLVGDLNMTMWSPYYRRFVNKTGLRNAREGCGILPSWPTSGTYEKVPPVLSLLLSIPIDHCLISPSIKVSNIRTGPNVGSDHRPVITDLVISGKQQ